jgi:hypothetical protein
MASLVEMFRTFLINRGLAKLELSPTTSGIWKIETSGSTATAIITTLYENASVALDRKNYRAQLIASGDIIKMPPYVEGRSTIAITDDEATEMITTDDAEDYKK